MECPGCKKEMEFGEVQSVDEKLNMMNSVFWYPEKDLGKLIKKNGASLELKAEPFYCEKCRKAIAVHDQK